MHPVARGAAVVAGVLVLAGLASGFVGSYVTPTGPVSPVQPSYPPAPVYVPTPSGSAVSGPQATPRCQVRGQGELVLPDGFCTPGVTDPAVRQDNLIVTICHPGYAKKMRPSTGITRRIKRRVMAAYGFTGQPLADFELDHLVPLSWGGAPSDERNLWPERGPSPNPKDRLEQVGLQAICEGRLSLADAQSMIRDDWIRLAQKLNVKM